MTSIDVSNFNTENVINMGYMFYECFSLTSIDLSNFNTEHVTNMVIMFSNCYSLHYIDLSNFITNDEEVFLFTNLTKKGNIIINNRSKNKFKVIPSDWQIKYVN